MKKFLNSLDIRNSERMQQLGAGVPDVRSKILTNHPWKHQKRQQDMVMQVEHFSAMSCRHG